MALVQKSIATIPAGDNHTGQIVRAEETTRDFGQGKEPTVEIVIQPDYQEKGKTTQPVTVNFSPSLNGVSGLSRLLHRLKVNTPKEGESFDVGTLVGVQVRFASEINENGFVRVKKNTIAKM